MNILEYLKENIVFLDGGTGTLLQEAGLRPGEKPETWNLSHPDVVKNIHKAYYDAGSNIVSANTFGANLLKFSEAELEEVIRAAMENVKAARDESCGTQEKWVAFDIGPTGRMLAPYGDFDFEEAVSVFAASVRLAEKYGAEILFIQTMNDSYETKAAVLAAKENSSLPVFVGNAYGEDGKLMTGASPAAMVAMLEGMGADAIGVNCSLGPRALSGVIEEYLAHASVPVLLKPNAGLPRAESGKTVYDVLPEEFAKESAKLIEKGVRIAGGCCGTTPLYIEELIKKAKRLKPAEIVPKRETVVSSYTHTVSFGDSPVLIGERINPTGKKRFKEALLRGDMEYILREGVAQKERGVHILDVNVGLPEIDEVSMLRRAVCELQAILDLPLQIDSSDPVALETALRRYNGKAMVNSVNGKEESMVAVFPLVKKYGGVVVALTLDEDGIPEKAEGRLKIAERILATAKKYGIDQKNIVFDPLALTISADSSAAVETLRAVQLIRSALACHTSLGVSNVSFGLPSREIINSNFFALALARGLSAAIMNPYSVEMMKTYMAFCALMGKDENCANLIAFAETLPRQEAEAPASAKAGTATGATALSDAIIKGLRDAAASLARELLESREPLSVVQEEIIPALDTVGRGFEEKTVYLPQLLMSAEAAKAAFEEVRAASKKEDAAEKCSVVIATVRGDIHDIGKNIVKLLLENYGFSVYDLGKDVKPETIVEEVKKRQAPLVGLSALMTTTVPAMEETIQLLRKEAPACRVVVGGAVLTKEYAEAIGADRYAKDAMESVRYAEEIFASL